MAKYELSKTADRRLGEIFEYSCSNFGIRRARRYLADLHCAFEFPATNPLMGTDQGQVKSGLRRFVHQSHRIYYRRTGTGVRIVEVLHGAQKPTERFGNLE